MSFCLLADSKVFFEKNFVKCAHYFIDSMMIDKDYKLIKLIRHATILKG